MNKFTGGRIFAGFDLIIKAGKYPIKMSVQEIDKEFFLNHILSDKTLWNPPKNFGEKILFSKELEEDIKSFSFKKNPHRGLIFAWSNDVVVSIINKAGELQYLLYTFNHDMTDEEVLEEIKS